MGGGDGSLFLNIERSGGGEGPPPASQQALDMSAFFGQALDILKFFMIFLHKSIFEPYTVDNSKHQSYS